MAKRIYTEEQKIKKRAREAAFRARVKADPAKREKRREIQRNWQRRNRERRNKMERERLAANPEKRTIKNQKRYQRQKELRRNDLQWRERDNEYQRKKYQRKRQERNLLLSLMTPKQKIKFIANEKRIRQEKTRDKIVSKALAKQQERFDQIKAIRESKRTEKERLEIEAKRLQMEGLQNQKRIFENERVDKAIERLKEIQHSRLHRYKQSIKSPRDRYLWAIDYYYQLIEENSLKQAA